MSAAEAMFAAIRSGDDLAARFGHEDAAKLLLERGADPAARNAEGETPRDLAAASGHHDLVELLSDG